MSAEPDATTILNRLSSGDALAAEELFAVVYDSLRALAGSYMRGRGPSETLNATALVHEVYVKLVRSGGDYNGREHFMAVAARAMRQILQDHARGRQAAKRGGGWERLTLSAAPAGDSGSSVDILAFNDALERLAALDQRQYRIVELRCFGGLNVDEIAAALDVSKSTVEKEWVRVRAWLSRELEQPVE